VRATEEEPMGRLYVHRWWRFGWGGSLDGVSDSAIVGDEIWVHVIGSLWWLKYDYTPKRS
jgi:hypothetical protein